MQRETPRAGLWLRILLVLIGLLGLLVAYYWVHKPFDLGVALRIGGALLDLLTAGALFVIAAGVGRWLLARLDLTGITRAERAALETACGLGLIAAAAVLLGLLGLFSRASLWLPLLFIAVVLRRSLRAALADGRALMGAVGAEIPHFKGHAAFITLMLGLALLTALAMPHHWDELVYHLLGPVRYLEAGRIEAQLDNFYLGFPQQTEMLYSITISLLGRDTAAAPVHFGFGVLGLLASAGAARRFAGRAAGWMTVVLLLSSFNLAALFGWPYADLPVLTYGALALIAAERWRETRADGWLLLMGALGGLAFSVKYTAAALLLALGVFVAWHERRAPARLLRGGLILGLTAAFVFLPWAIKGLALYGNPVYPFIFNGVNWDAGRSAAFSFSGRGLLGMDAAWQIPILPVAATVFGLDKTDGFGFTAGPWLLTAFLLLIPTWGWLSARARSLARDAGLLLAPLLIFWAVMAALSSVGMQTRLVMMALPLFAVLGALGFVGLEAWPRKPIDVRFIIRAMLVITLALGAVDALRSQVRDQVVPHLLGIVSADEFMYANSGAYYPAMRQLETLPAGSQVRLMWEPRAYYCPDHVTCRPDVLFDYWARPLVLGASADEAFADFRAQGDDYLLLFHTGFELYSTYSAYVEQDVLFLPALERWMTPIWSDNVRYTLYTWRADAP
jgi:hypothetical protein